jgi:exodeoxyribonuclease-3
MKRIITLNVNGIRSAAKKGFFKWFAEQDADVICLQEIKAEVEQLDDPLFWPEGYHCHYYSAQKKGYSGVALYSKEKPLAVQLGLAHDLFDAEGRAVHAQFKEFSVSSLYFPSGTSGDIRQQVKYDFLDYYFKHLKELRQQKNPVILCGDWNIAHKNIDLKNWRGNQKNSGFLPEERAWLDQVFDQLGFVDAFRAIDKNPEQYTWWSNRGQAWQKNVGWRIDYQIVTPNLEKKILHASIYKAERFSDHAPLVIDYDL